MEEAMTWGVDMRKCGSAYSGSGVHNWIYAHSADGGDYYICDNYDCGDMSFQHVDGDR